MNAKCSFASASIPICLSGTAYDAIGSKLALGSVSGDCWGMLIGLIFLNPLLGAAVGAGVGAVSGALTDVGVSNDFMKELAANFKPGGSALFVLVLMYRTQMVQKLGEDIVSNYYCFNHNAFTLCKKLGKTKT